MPKRVPTPPPADDEPKYLTVCNPYPGAPNMELLGDRKAFVFWLACCTGKDPLVAFFYKPKSDKIIIEVSRTFKGWRQLLGEHRWSEFLKNPEKHEERTVSQIFYCLYSHGREVQKNGWKRVYVEEVWFNAWSPINKIIQDPYPLTHFCEVPVEDKTNYPLCRVLPVEHFPRLLASTPEIQLQTQARLPPVGSEAWAVAKESGTLTSSAWAKGPPNSKAKNARPSVSPTLKISSTFAAGPPRLDTNGWRGPSLPNIYAPTPGSAIPPGLSRLETNVSEGSSNSPGWEIPPILSRGPSAIGSSGSSDVDSIRATPIAPESPDIQIAGEGFEEAMSGLGVYDEDEDDLWNIGVSVNVAIAPNAEETLPNLWEDYGKKEPEIPKEDIVCRVHGKICPKGICKQRKSQEKELEKKKREAERAQDGKKKKDKPWRVASDTDNNGARGDKIKFLSRQKPPHLAESASSPTVEDPPPANSPNTTRGKPPHLGKSSPTEPAPAKPTAPAARPARGRRMNTNTDGPVSPSSPTNEMVNAAQTRNLRSDARSVAASSSGGWGPPVDLWAAVSVGRAAIIKNDDTRSVAASSNGGWGSPVDIYSGVPSLNERRAPPAISKDVNTVKQGSASTVKKSWADEMEEDDAHSVVESVNGGWGTISNSPWS